MYTLPQREENISFGSRMKGAVGPEIKDAVNDSSKVVLSYIAGLGGRDIRVSDIRNIVTELEEGRGDCFYGLRKELL